MESSQDLGDMRIEMVENTQEYLRDCRNMSSTVRTVLSSRSYSGVNNTQTFLKGVEVGLQIGEMEIDGLNSELMYGQGVPDALDLREVADEDVSKHLHTLVTEANNENWGNVQANLSRLDEALADAMEDGEDDG